MKTRIIPVIVALILISCEKRDPKLDSKLNQLEKQAAEAIDRQQQLEEELAEQKILAERDAIERERALIEQERVAMEEAKNADNEAALAEFQRRQMELMERDQKISETQRELNDREQELTGLEAKLSERELDLAGREPLEALPPIEKNYVSGPTGDYNNFYEPLAAYGSWFQTTDYGYVYQPAVVRDRSWRPYTRGRWAFTNHGWTWVSNEPFGWACYHYGRWSLLRNIGWVWIPGNQWAPAWVTWRESTGHIGWAPLPPETLAWSSNSWDSSVDVRYGIDSGWFSFISYNNFGNDIYGHCLPYSQNIVIYQTTTTVTHYVIQDRRVYCGGPRYRNVCDRIGRRFPIHQLRFDPCPDFGRGGRRLNSQFSGNELQVVAPRMDADWNRALRPSRISRDLGEVVVNRSEELPEDVRKQYRERKHEEDEKAERWVANTGGRDAFENDRKIRLGKNREEVAKSEALSRNAREPRSETNKKVERPNSPVVTDTTDLPSDKTKRPHTRDSKRLIPETPTTSDPEKPVAPDKKRPQTLDPEMPVAPDTKTPTIPKVPDNKLDENHQEKSKQSKLPRGVVPVPPVTDDNLVPNRLVEPPVRSDRPHIDETSKRPQLPLNKDAELQSEIDKKAARELLLQQEQQREIARQQELENRKVQQKQEQLEQAQRQLQEKQEKLNKQLDQTERVREQKEQGDKLREQQEKQELANKEQQERLRAQQEQREQAREQQNQLREQQAKQELARKQQEDTQGRLEEQQKQQEKMRAQQEQQERARQQQEEAQRRMQEQQAKQREQQEQQEKMRAQQEQQERARQQQAEAQSRMQEQQEKQRAQQEQQERQRAQQEQQEQQERARQQQAEAQSRMQEQQERQRAQQEQQERQRAQQEQQEKQRAQQEQQERARQQQEDNQRRQQK